MDRITWDAHAYAMNSSPQTTWGMELIDKLALRDSQRLLDIGCGDGKLTAHIAGKFNACGITGIDLSAEMIGYARERFTHLHNLNFIQMDAAAITFDEPFDMAFSTTALHWIKDHRPMLQGLYRCLKPGAGILFQMSASGSYNGLTEPVARTILNDAYCGFFQNFEFPFALYTPDEYAQLLEEIGFIPLRVEILERPMRHDGREGLAGFLRAAWMPFTDRVPPERRAAFIDDIIAAYLADHPMGDSNTIEIPTSRFEIEAFKPA